MAIFQRLASVVDLQWPARRWPIHVFTAGAMVCLATSTICHLFGSFGYKKTAQKIWKYDYAGITVLIVTSFVPVVYYSFLCEPKTQLFYLVSTISLGLVTIAVSLMSTFQSVKYRTFRACLFASLGLWGVVPGVHALILYGAAIHLQKAFILDVLMGLTYLGLLENSALGIPNWSVCDLVLLASGTSQGGAMLYAARIPERFKPGAFDLAFNSHQIFHVAVVVAAGLHYWGVRILLQWRDTTGGCTLPFDDVIALQTMLNSTKQ